MTDTTTAVVWRGPDKLRPFLVPLEDLRPDPTNPRAHSPKNLDSIRGSFGLFGQQTPISIAPNGTITAGNGRWIALHQPVPIFDPATKKQIGEEHWTHIAAVSSDLTPEQLIAYGLADNRTGELAEWDLDTLAQQLGSLDEQLDLALIGWDEADILQLLEPGGKFDPESEWEGMPDFVQGDMQSAFRVTVHFKSDADADDFFETIDRKRVSYMWWPQDDGHKGSSLHEEWTAEEQP